MTTPQTTKIVTANLTRTTEALPMAVRLGRKREKLVNKIITAIYLSK